MFSHYKTLGVSYYATPKEILDAFVRKFNELVGETKACLVNCQAALETRLAPYSAEFEKQSMPTDLSTSESYRKIRYNTLRILLKQKKEISDLLEELSSVSASDKTSLCSEDFFKLFLKIEKLLNIYEKTTSSYASKRYSFFKCAGDMVCFSWNEKHNCTTAYHVLMFERQAYNRKLMDDLAEVYTSSMKITEQCLTTFLCETEPETLAKNKNVESELFILTSLQPYVKELYRNFQNTFLVQARIDKIDELTKKPSEETAEVSSDMLQQMTTLLDELVEVQDLSACLSLVPTNVHALFSLLSKIKMDRDNMRWDAGNTEIGTQLAKHLDTLLANSSSEMSALIVKTKSYSTTAPTFEDVENWCEAISALQREISDRYESIKRACKELCSTLDDLASNLGYNPTFK